MKTQTQTSRIKFSTSMSLALARARKEAGLSQYELAQKVEAPRASIKRWECDEVKSISQDVLDRLEEVLEAKLGPREPAEGPSPRGKSKGRSKPRAKVKGNSGEVFDGSFPMWSQRLNQISDRLQRMEVTFGETIEDPETLRGRIQVEDGGQMIDAVLFGVRAGKIIKDQPVEIAIWPQ